MTFNAKPIKTTQKLGKCKCGSEITLCEIPIWDSPGDCEPTIDSYEYMVYCNRCFVGTLRFDNPEVAIKIWNEFVK